MTNLQCMFIINRMLSSIGVDAIIIIFIVIVFGANRALNRIGLVQHEGESMMTDFYFIFLVEYFFNVFKCILHRSSLFSEATGTRSWLSTAPLQTPAAWWNCSIMRETEMVMHCCLYIMSILCNNADVLATEQHTHSYLMLSDSLLKVKHSVLMPAVTSQTVHAWTWWT